MGLRGNWKNNKTGNLYGVIREVINATNAQDGQVMVEYTRPDGDTIYVREKSEFLEKFTPTDENFRLE